MDILEYYDDFLNEKTQFISSELDIIVEYLKKNKIPLDIMKFHKNEFKDYTEYNYMSGSMSKGQRVNVKSLYLKFNKASKSIYLLFEVSHQIKTLINGKLPRASDSDDGNYVLTDKDYSLKTIKVRLDKVFEDGNTKIVYKEIDKFIKNLDIKFNGLFTHSTNWIK